MAKWIRQPRPKQNINELLKPLGDKSWRGNVWHPIVMNVPKDGVVPPPPVETYYLETELSEPLLTESGDNILYD